MASPDEQKEWLELFQKRVKLTKDIFKAIGELTPEKAQKVIEALNAKVEYEKLKAEQSKKDS